MEIHVKSLSTRNLYGAIDLILVMLGTNPYPFTRLMDQIVKYAETSGEKVIVQSGNTPVTSDIIEAYDFMPHKKLLELMKSADVVITQGDLAACRIVSHQLQKSLQCRVSGKKAKAWMTRLK